MAGKLHRLPQRTQEALAQFACLGNTAELVILSRIREETEERAGCQSQRSGSGWTGCPYGESLRFSS